MYGLGITAHIDVYAHTPPLSEAFNQSKTSLQTLYIKCEKCMIKRQKHMIKSQHL